MSSTEELVGLVLAALHPRLRERCTESKILAVLEEDCGAYDIKTLRTLLETRHGFDTARRQRSSHQRSMARRSGGCFSSPCQQLGAAES